MSTPRTIATIEDLRALVGHELGSTEWVEITQERVDLFADATEDHQWIHVDVERAEAGPSAAPSRTASSPCRCCPPSAPSSSRSRSAAPGSTTAWRALHQPRAGRLADPGTATFEEVNDLPKGTQVVTRYVAEIEGVERPACVARQITLVTG